MEVAIVVDAATAAATRAVVAALGSIGHGSEEEEMRECRGGWMRFGSLRFVDGSMTDVFENRPLPQKRGERLKA